MTQTQLHTTNRYINKARVEALSDGVFAIAMTLLVFNIKTPMATHHLTEKGVLDLLASQSSYFISYFVSFIVLGMFWMSHNAFFHFFSRSVNRVLAQLNMLYLMFVVFIPFSAYFLGEYEYSHIAVLVYGINIIIIIGAINYAMFAYALHSQEIDTSHVNKDVVMQSRIRALLTPLFALLGIIFSAVSIEFAKVFFAFPVIFHIVPKSFFGAERLLGIKLEQD